MRPIKVQFLIGGTQKGGTTALDAYLRMHPSVKMAQKKEVHFFDNEAYFKNTEVNYSLYHANFTPDNPNQILGEATPIYMYWRPSPKRICKYNPAMKWILILRNPIERAYSQWNMESKRRTESLPFIDALLREKALSQSLANQHRVYSYVDRGFYSEQIQRILQYFPVQQMFFLKSEDLQNATKDSLNKVCDFLEIKNMPETSYKKMHVGSYDTGMPEAERAYMKEVFKIEIHALEKLLGWDCGSWLV
ncbi:MAG: sulfotransferase domain-containing protein [Gallionella sp.]